MKNGPKVDANFSSPADPTPPATLGWKHQAGRRPHTVVIQERLDRGGALQIRYTFQGQRPMPLLPPPHPQTIWGSDARGRKVIDPKAEAHVQGLAADVLKALLNGTDPMALIHPPMVALAPPPAAPPLLTLRALVDEAAPDLTRGNGPSGQGCVSSVAARRGVYGMDSPEAREFRALAVKGATAMEGVLHELGAGPFCADVHSGDWVTAGRQMLDAFSNSHGNHTSGLRSVERALGALARCGNWLSGQGGRQLEEFHTPKPGWKVELRTYLERLSASPLLRVQRPRHTAEEGSHLMNLIFDETADLDPRFRLLVILGFPLRLGQVTKRLWRSCIDLKAKGAFDSGNVFVPESGKKPSAGFDLDPVERAWIDRALDGHLGELEAAFRRGALKDYPLVPKGRLRAGVVPFVPGGAPPRPMSDRRLLQHFVQAEAWVGVNHVPGRSWYGLRRLCADLGAQVTSDQDVRAMLGGWAMEGTRAGVYRNREDPSWHAATGQARVALRQLLLAAAVSPAAHTVRPKPPFIGRDSEAATQQHRAAAEQRATQGAKRKRGRGAVGGVRKSRTSGVPAPALVAGGRP